MALRSKESHVVLDYVKAHPGMTSVDIAEATKISPLIVASTLSSLYTGRYIDRVKSDKTNAAGLKLFTYTLRSETPRKKRRDAGKVHGKPARVHGASELTLMIAVKGSKETLVLTLDQVRDLRESLNSLVV